MIRCELNYSMAYEIGANEIGANEIGAYEIGANEIAQNEREINIIKEQFMKYTVTQPNLVNCWLNYLSISPELKKRHYDINQLKTQCNTVLQQLEQGYKDFTAQDLIHLIIFKKVMR